MSYQREREEFIAVCVNETTGDAWDAIDIARKILRDAQVLQNYAVNRCNREVSKAEEGRALAASNRIIQHVETLGFPGVLVGGDPRGNVVKIKLPSGLSNHWGGETWGVPIR